MSLNGASLNSSLAEEAEKPLEYFEMTTLPIGLENVPSELASLEESIDLGENALEHGPVRIASKRSVLKNVARCCFILLLLSILLVLLLSLVPFFWAKLYCTESETDDTFNGSQSVVCFRIQRLAFICENMHFPKW